MTEITIKLPDNVYKQASRLASLTNSNVESVLSDTIKSALLPFELSGIDFKPIENLSDNEVLAESNLMMDKKQGKRLNRLLERQQEEKLTVNEKVELASLMQTYQECFLRKGLAIAEAVRRGLRESV